MRSLIFRYGGHTMLTSSDRRIVCAFFAAPTLFGAVMFLVLNTSSGAAASTLVPVHPSSSGPAAATPAPFPSSAPLRIAAGARDPFMQLSQEPAAGSSSSSSSSGTSTGAGTTSGSTTGSTTSGGTSPTVTVPAGSPTHFTPPGPTVVNPPAPQPTSSALPPTHDLDGFLIGLVTSNPAPCSDPLAYTPGAKITLTDDATGHTLASSTISSCAGIQAGSTNQQEFYFQFTGAPLTAKMHVRVGSDSWPLTLNGLSNAYGWEFVLAAPGSTPTAYPSNGVG
jgi:hypothetical protein